MGRLFFVECCYRMFFWHFGVFLMLSQEDKELFNAISYLQSIGDWNSGNREIVAGRLRQARECIQYLEDRNDAILENRPRLAHPVVTKEEQSNHFLTKDKKQ